MGKLVRKRLRRFLSDDRATSDVEYILLVALVILPLCLIIPYVIIDTNASFFDRINIFVNLPFP